MRKTTLRYAGYIGIVLLATLIWELTERVFALLALSFSLSIGPFGVDIHVLAISVYCNFGSLIGIIIVYFIAKRHKKKSTPQRSTRQGSSAQTRHADAPIKK